MIPLLTVGIAHTAPETTATVTTALIGVLIENEATGGRVLLLQSESIIPRLIINKLVDKILSLLMRRAPQPLFFCEKRRNSLSYILLQLVL